MCCAGFVMGLGGGMAVVGEGLRMRTNVKLALSK